MSLKCTRCKKPVPEDGTAVYSAGDYDPFCSQKCHDDYFQWLSDEMGRINAMTDDEFHRYMTPWAGTKDDPLTPKSET